MQLILNVKTFKALNCFIVEIMRYPKPAFNILDFTQVLKRHAGLFREILKFIGRTIRELIVVGEKKVLVRLFH